MQIKTIIIDDTPLAVEKLEGFVMQVPVLKHLKSFNRALEAIQFMQNNQVDLVFLDIQMEEFSGLQFMNALQTHPQIVIVSAYGEYAIEGFEHNVTDYLLKPYSLERFLRAVDKVIKQNTAPVQKECLFVKIEYRMERVNFSDILYIVGQGAYLQIVKKGGMKVMTLMNFEQVLSQLPANNFVRTHRSYIVAIDKIDSIERNLIFVGRERIPIGKSYAETFFSSL